MNKILVVLSISVLVGCGTSSKKLIDLPPLAKDAPVEMFWSIPNIKFDRVCTIEANWYNSLGSSFTQKEDFENMFKAEARKCGANGAIFGFMHGYTQGSIMATATGIRIKGQAAKLTDKNQIKAFFLAIQSKDLEKVKELIENVPKSQAERAPTDDDMINTGLYIATLDGMNCDTRIVNLLEDEYGGRVTKFKAIEFHSSTKPSSNAPLCKDVIARSLSKMRDKSKAVIEINNYYVALLNQNYDKSRDKKAARYAKLLSAAATTIAEACKVSSTDPVCAMKGAYLNFANKSKVVKTNNIQKNARTVLSILK